MSEQQKTIAIRVSQELRGRLDSVLQITGMNVNAAGVEALTRWIEAKLADPKVRARALKDLEAEQKKLEARRMALQDLVSETTTASAGPEPDDGPADPKPADIPGTPKPGENPAASKASEKPAGGGSGVGKPAPRRGGGKTS